MSTLSEKLNLLRPENITRYCRRNTKAKQLSTQYRLGTGSKRIYHYHIRKTGGTSLNHIFLSLDGAKAQSLYRDLTKSTDKRIFKSGKVFVGWNKNLIQKGNYFYAFSHIPKHKVRLSEDTFTITILRNPVERLISHYNMLLEYIKGSVKHPALEIEKKWMGAGFDEFLNNIPKKDLLRQIYMFSKHFNANEAFENIINCSHFFFTEDFSFGVKALSKKLDLDLKAIHIRKTKEKAKLNEKERAMLKAVLEPEINLYSRLRRYQSTKY